MTSSNIFVLANPKRSSFKASFRNEDIVARVLVAFANTHGGR